MKKLMMILFASIFIMGLVASLEIDNVKEFERKEGERYGSITITNGFGLGQRLAKYTLLDNTDICLYECYATGIAELDVPSKLFTQVDFEDNQRRPRNVLRQKMQLKTGTEQYQEKVEDTQRVCTGQGNTTHCEDQVIRTRTITKTRDVWGEYDQSILPAGTYTWRIAASKKPTESIDWIAHVHGIALDEWTFWVGVTPSAYYKFNEAVGNATDSSGNGLTLQNFNASYQSGKLFNAVRLNDSMTVAALNISNNAAFRFQNNNFTIAFWFNASACGSGGIAFAYMGRDAGGNGWDIVCQANGNITFGSNGTTIATTTSALNNSVYHRIVLVKEGINTNDFKLYVDGGLNRSGSHNKTISNNTSPFRIENAATGAAATPIFIDDLQFFNNYAWTAADVTFDYNGGVGLEAEGGTIAVTLLSPANAAFLFGYPINFTANLALPLGINATNATLFIWRSNGVLVANQYNTTIQTNETINVTFSNSTLAIGSYIWNVLGCGINATGSAQNCSFAVTNRSFDFGYIINGATFNNPVGELSSQLFTLNATLYPGLLNYDATLFYNNTAFLASKVSEGVNTIFSRTIVIPDVSVDINKTFIWQLALTDTSGTSYFNVSSGTQQVNAISLDNCAVNTVLVFNFTVRDEDTQAIITASPANNVTIEVELNISNMGVSSVFSTNFSGSNPAQICIQSGILNTTTYRLDGLVRYQTFSRVSEFYNIQNFTLSNNSIPQNVNLYDLLIVNSQEFLISVKDQNLVPVQNALIYIQRKYIPEGTFKTVEVPKTDIDGKAIGHFVLSDVIYTILVYKNGKLLATFANVAPVCTNAATGDCKINLNIGGSTTRPDSFINKGGLSYYAFYNSSSRLYLFTFTSIDGSTRAVSLNVTAVSPTLNKSICFTSTSQVSGTLLCSIPDSFGNGTGIAVINVDGSVYLTNSFKIQNAGGRIGYERYFFAFLLIITLPFMVIGSPELMIIMFIVGFISAISLVFIDQGAVVGTVSSVLWLGIAGAILIFIINKEKKT